MLHSSFEDFAAGNPGNGGVNLYVARPGRIEMINRLDFNNDGYLDLIVTNDHSHVEGADVLVYWGTKDGPRSLMPPMADKMPRLKLMDETHARRSVATRLPSYGGGRSILVDLNGDDRKEIVFCNYKHNYTIYENALIYWNSPQGYSPNRRTELPTILPGGVSAADFNQDGFVDLVFANRGNFEQRYHVTPYGHRESYIYWNGPTGFHKERRTSVPALTAVDCAAEDFNGDGYPELLLVNNNRQERSVYLYWGGEEGFSEHRRDRWESADPVSVQLADLDGDKQQDLILMQANDKLEIWRGTGSGFEEKPWTTLPTLKAKQCAVGDLDGNGIPEVVVANRDVRSFIYWGRPQGYSADDHSELPTLRASDVTLEDFNADGVTEALSIVRFYRRSCTAEF